MEAAPIHKLWTAGGYVRLSSDDRRKKGDSIAIQKSIIEKFIAEDPAIRFHDFFTDNAQTGTSFDRPAFNQMLEAAEKGIINCIVVKDLSRFGRNAIDAGYYIERHLPALGVRLIAINDNYDSNEGDGGIAVPLANIVNEAYALDISRKCRAVLKEKIASGKFVGRLPPYGYLKDPRDHHHLVVNDDTAPVVRQLFLWVKEGYRPNEISHMLNDAGVLPPSRDRQEKGHVRDATVTGPYWYRNAILGILTERVYLGDMVQGKTQGFGRRRTSLPPDQWVTVENTHQPIIEHRLYEEVQAILKRVAEEDAKHRNPAVPFSPSVFRGRVFCGHCGYAMHRHRQNKDGVYWFRCQSQLKFSKTACMQVSIKEEDVRVGAVVMLRKYAEMLLGRKVELCRREMAQAPDPAIQKAELTQIRQEAAKHRDALKTLFERLVRGELDPDAFARLKKEHGQKMDSLTERGILLEASPKQIEARVRECWELADSVSEVANSHHPTVELLDKYVEKILVWHDKGFEIVWKFGNPFEEGGNEGWAM